MRVHLLGSNVGHPGNLDAHLAQRAARRRQQAYGQPLPRDLSVDQLRKLRLQLALHRWGIEKQWGDERDGDDEENERAGDVRSAYCASREVSVHGALE